MKETLKEFLGGIIGLIIFIGLLALIIWWVVKDGDYPPPYTEDDVGPGGQDYYEYIQPN